MFNPSISQVANINEVIAFLNIFVCIFFLIMNSLHTFFIIFFPNIVVINSGLGIGIYVFKCFYKRISNYKVSIIFSISLFNNEFFVRKSIEKDAIQVGK